MTVLSMNGKVKHITVKEYEGKTTISLQFLAKTEQKGYEVIKVKLTQELDGIKENDMVHIPVIISTMNNNIYYTQNGKIQKI